ncbi:hypothetical protein DXN04_07760 [Chitinophaga silvisoli]|uniref:Uncharacterized protein n=1 Tax=Chitinophaga silvisoli TaxID=2291814 RepID=A0A3E1P5L4_9BACT|nr:hypothetical protein DXN04_07760 [Chitinophaga silvisoli]
MYGITICFAGKLALTIDLTHAPDQAHLQSCSLNEISTANKKHAIPQVLKKSSLNTQNGIIPTTTNLHTY